MKKPNQLVIYTHVSHHTLNGKIVAHSGFVLEIDIWSKIFETVTVVGPYSEEAPLADAIPYSNSNIHYHSMGSAKNTRGLVGKFVLLRHVLTWFKRGSEPLTASSIIMSRGPGSAGMIGAILAKIYRLPHFAKYADQLSSYPGETFGTKLQRRFIMSRFFGGPVLVYGDKNPNRPHLVPLNLPLSITESEWIEAGDYIKQRLLPPPYRLLFVGRVTSQKGLDVLIHTVNGLISDGFDIQLDIVGDGDARESFEDITKELSLENNVIFHGWVSRTEVFNFYKDAFCLINCSKRQGIDKTLIEAMAHGLPVIGTNANMARIVLEPPRCGLVYEIDDLTGLYESSTASPNKSRTGSPNG